MSDLSKQIQKSNPWQLRMGERRVLLLVGDLLMGITALVISLYYWGTSERFLGFSLEFLQRRVPVWFFFLPFIWILLLVELYDVHRAGDWRRTVRGILIASVIGLLLYLLLYFYYVDPSRSLLPRRGFAGFLLIVASLTLVWRVIYIRIFTAQQFLRKGLVVGAGRSGRLILEVMHDLGMKPFFLVGIVDDDPEKLGKIIEGYSVIGNSQNLLHLVIEHNVSDILVAITGEIFGDMFQALLDAQEIGAEITRMPVAYEEWLGRVPIQTLETNWILRSFVDEARVSIFYELGKRLFDIIGGLAGVLCLLFILPFVTLAILFDDGRPIFYAQMRAGKGGQPYLIYKLRTMHRDAEADGHPRWASEGDQRTTRFGKLLRKTHLDELPQFINVLRGEMSLVGPRAERPELIDLFQEKIPFYRARLLVKPGITGWAQVNFGYASTVEETMKKLEYDLYYIKHRGIMLDLIILLRTPSMMLGFRGR